MVKLILNLKELGLLKLQHYEEMLEFLNCAKLSQLKPFYFNRLQQMFENFQMKVDELDLDHCLNQSQARFNSET
jgi:response regulator of citrate/malate metabolism